MQTFLPLPDYRATAAVLDYRRLGKQRVECYQLLLTLSGRSQGWKSHPCVKMWKGYEGALKQYAIDICDEWIARGYKDTTKAKIEEFDFPPTLDLPPWVTPEFCSSHRSNLLRKDYKYYNRFGWEEPEDLPYVWPESKVG